ncbi:MAG: hypothetical protein K5989_12615 [Lachnospiraceae bacterium]|nr:hypothetical protein [Lachnospiraceae bacterium]
MKKQRGAAAIFGAILIPIPIIGFVIYSLVSKDMEMKTALIIGGVVSLIFLIFTIFAFLRNTANNTYEAQVIKKEKRRRIERSSSNRDNRSRYEGYDYIIHVRTRDGKNKRIVETDHSRVMAFNYLNEGDQFRYHPQFAFPYELYDKSRADGIYCVGCQTKNSVLEDRCKKCGLPLLK